MCSALTLTTSMATTMSRLVCWCGSAETTTHLVLTLLHNRRSFSRHFTQAIIATSWSVAHSAPMTAVSFDRTTVEFTAALRDFCERVQNANEMNKIRENSQQKTINIWQVKWPKMTLKLKLCSSRLWSAFVYVFILFVYLFMLMF